MSKVTEAVEEVFKELRALSDEDFVKLLDEEEEKMKKAVLGGYNDIGIALWYGKDPVACQAWIDEVLKNGRNGS